MATFRTNDTELISFDESYLWVTKKIPTPMTVKVRLKHNMLVAELLVAMDNIRGLDDAMFRMMAENELDLRDEGDKEYEDEDDFELNPPQK